MDYDKLKNTKNNFCDIMNIKTETKKDKEEISETISSLKQNLTFLSDLLTGYKD